MLFSNTETEKAIKIIESSAKTGMSSRDIITQEVTEWLASDKRNMMLTGESYYLNHTNIQHKRRTLVNGAEVLYRSNVRLEHSFYKKLVDQKVGYLLSKPPSVTTADEAYTQKLDLIFDRNFLRLLSIAGREAINKGIAWVQIYFKGDAIAFKLIPSEQIIPLWLDSAHTEMNELIRVYEVMVYNGRTKELVRKVEHWSVGGVNFYEYTGGSLIEDVNVADKDGNAINYHFTINGKPYNWERLPFIPFRANDLEQPLIDTVKSLIDNYNLQASINADLLADIPQFIYKLIGYAGENLATFINDIQQYLAVKLDHGGDVDKLQADPNTAALEAELKRMRKEIFSCGNGVDTQEDNLGSASGVALKFRYADLDSDCNIIETEFQYSLEQLLWFIAQYFKIVGAGDFSKTPVDIIFNRDIIINESEVITNCRDSLGFMPDVQVRANHPWSDGNTERLWEEQQTESREEDNYNKNVFGQQGGVDDAE